MAAYAAFGAYAVAASVFSGGEDQVWAIWAACGYAVALFMLWRWSGRGSGSPPSESRWRWPCSRR